MENFTKIIDRLKYFLDYQGDNFNQLAGKIGVSNSYFSKMYKNKGSLGEETIQKILLNYENLSPDWLLFGKDPMLRGQMSLNNTAITGSACENKSILAKACCCDRLFSLLEEKNSQINELHERIGILKYKNKCHT